MKFLPVALAALIGFTEAKKNISGKDLQARVKKGQYNKQSLMRGAKPHSAAAKRRVEEDADEEEEWAINGLYSVQFNSCLSLTVQDEDLFDENLISYAAQGQLTAHKSYILFDVCYTEDCYYQADDAKMTFITDIASFFAAFSDFLPNKVESYCEGCQENEDYCLGNMDEEEAAEEEDAEEDADEAEEDSEEDDGEDENEGDEDGDEDDGGEDDGEDDADEDGEDRKVRKLSKVAELKAHRVLANKEVQYIDCDLCQEYECFEDENEDGDDNADDAVQYEFEDALEWLEGLSGCQAVEDYTWNDIALYAVLICNSEGTGVEVGVFVDEDCAVYTNQESFKNIMSESDQEYFSMSRDVVEYMFTNDFSCYDQEIEYINPYTEANEDEEEEEEEDNGDAPEAAEWCQDLFDGDEMEATNMYDCGAEDEDADEGDDAADDAEDEYLDTYDWYSYQLTEDQRDDAGEVCLVVNALNGEYATVYDSGSSGNLYDYTKKSNKFNTPDGLSGGAIAGILFVVITLAAAGAYAFRGKSTNDKKAPLINNGSMA